MNWLNRSKRTPIGIDVDGRWISAIQMSQRERAWHVEAATVIPRVGGLGAPNAEEIRRLNDVLYRQGFTGERIVLAVPDAMLLAGVMDLPPMTTEAPLDQIVRMELARIHRCDPQVLELAYWSLPARRQGSAASNPANDARAGMHVMAAACTVPDALPLLDAFENHGLDVRALDVHSWAMTRACAPLVDGAQTAAALLDIRWSSAVLVLRHQNVVVYERTLAEAGLQPLHASLMAQFDLTSEVVDHLLSDIGLAGALEAGAGSERRHELVNDVHPVIAAHLDALVREVRASCSYMNHRYSDAAPKLLLLLGPGASMPGLAEHLGQALDMEAQQASPAALASCPAALARLCRNPHLITAMGLAQFTERAA